MSSEDNEFEDPKFTATYTCQLLAKRSEKHIERGGKLILPSSALEVINALDIPYPLMFKVSNESNSRYTHAGVLEFTAEEGKILIPQWMTKNLGLKAGDIVTVETVALPSATYCRIEPLTRNFAYVSDAESVFETNLKNFACLTEGDVLFIYEKHQNQMYKVKVFETKPESAVNIFDCEMELELSVPEKSVVKKKKANKTEDKVSTEIFTPFQGKGHRLDGTVESSTKEETSCKINKTFITFKGEGHCLDSMKRKTDSQDSVGPPTKKLKQEKEEQARNKSEELLFIRKKQKEFVDSQSDENSQPFQGQGHSLKD